MSSYSDCCPLKDILLLGVRCFVVLACAVYIGVCRYSIKFYKYCHNELEIITRSLEDKVNSSTLQI